MKKVVLTYGTFDLFHIGHLKLLERLKSLGDELHVGVSTDDFNKAKGKKTIISFEDRIEIVGALKCVDATFPESTWDQKAIDIRSRNVSILGMGDDWKGKFDFLQDICAVVYLPRTDAISTTILKQSLSELNSSHVNQLNKALELLNSISSHYSK